MWENGSCPIPRNIWWHPRMCLERGIFTSVQLKQIHAFSTDKHEAINLYHQKFIHSFPTHRAKK